MSIETAPCDSDVTVTVNSWLTHLCPFKDEVDHGTITITWHVAGQTLELHSLRAYLDSFAQSQLSHEQITDVVRHDLSIVPGIRLVSVDSCWHTAGMEVRCSTSPIPEATGRVQP